MTGTLIRRGDEDPQVAHRLGGPRKDTAGGGYRAELCPPTPPLIPILRPPPHSDSIWKWDSYGVAEVK